MEKKLLVESTTMSAAFLAFFLIMISIPAVMATTPPYYSGPYQIYANEEGIFIECAQLGIYDYQNPPATNAPWPCILHQAYSYVFGDWEFDGDLTMYYAGADASLNTLYNLDDEGSGYCAQYVWPASPGASVVVTSLDQVYRNTVTQEVYNPVSPQAVVTG